MIELTFQYNIKKDIDNYLHSVYKFEYLGHGRQREKIRTQLVNRLLDFDFAALNKVRDKKEAEKLIGEYLEKWLYQNKDIIELNSNSLYSAWEKRQKIFTSNCEKLIKRKIDFSLIKVYFTTLTICPYRYPYWFMVSLKEGLEHQLYIIYHELFHFIFIKYYKDYCLKQGLSVNQFEILKEALTVFLNLSSFKSINTVRDRGYPAEKILREIIIQEYLKSKSFKKTIVKAIKWLKMTPVSAL